MRKTKIICTLGPAVDSEDMIRTLIRTGMDAARFNFSHGSHPEHLARLNMLKAVRDAMGRPIATILDTKGPEIRIKSFETKSISLEPGDPFTLTTEDVTGNQGWVSVTYPQLHQELQPGQEILIDDGLVAIRVDRIEGTKIICTVENGGTLSANKSINIPGVHIQLPALTEKDVDDIRFGVENDFDFIAASFVRRAADVEAVRAVLHECGGDDVKIIAKIENQEGVDNLDEILEAADGIMVARGDLGVEIPAARVPILQKQMIRKGLQVGKGGGIRRGQCGLRRHRQRHALRRDRRGQVSGGGPSGHGHHCHRDRGGHRLLEAVPEAAGPPCLQHQRRHHPHLLPHRQRSERQSHPYRYQFRPKRPDDLPVPARLPHRRPHHA